MGGTKNFGDSLVEEVLTDVAESFFGARKELDDLSDLFMAYVDRLQEAARHVEVLAGRLNHLLARDEVRREFYRMLEVEQPGPYLHSPFKPEDRRISVPFALTERGRYIKLVVQRYADLQRLSETYTRGPAEADDGTGEPPVYYNLVRSMCELINEKVCNVRDGMSPACVLQYAKKFYVQHAQQAKVTGATAGTYAHMDSKFECQPIDFDQLDLVQFPELPKTDHVKADIVAFCKRHYSAIQADVPDLLAHLRR